METMRKRTKMALEFHDRQIIGLIPTHEAGEIMRTT